MYVGVTRAKDRLYLVRAFRRTIWGRSEVNEPSRFLRDVAQAAKGTTMNGGRPTTDDRRPTGASPSAWRDSSGSASSRGVVAPAPSQRPSAVSRPAPAIGGQASSVSRQSSAATKSSEGNQLQFKPGDRVNHGLFGEGIVLKSASTLDDEEVTVAFPGKGTKTLLASFAKLHKAA
jgi:DNA helicase-2/ATP-dependent DNA helicase PcrA